MVNPMQSHARSGSECHFGCILDMGIQVKQYLPKLASSSECLHCVDMTSSTVVMKNKYLQGKTPLTSSFVSCGEPFTSLLISGHYYLGLDHHENKVPLPFK